MLIVALFVSSLINCSVVFEFLLFFSEDNLSSSFNKSQRQGWDAHHIQNLSSRSVSPCWLLVPYTSISGISTSLLRWSGLSTPPGGLWVFIPRQGPGGGTIPPSLQTCILAYLGDLGDFSLCVKVYENSYHASDGHFALSDYPY